MCFLIGQKNAEQLSSWRKTGICLLQIAFITKIDFVRFAFLSVCAYNTIRNKKSSCNKKEGEKVFHFEVRECNIVELLVKARQEQQKVEEATKNVRNAADALLGIWKGSAAEAFDQEQEVLSKWCSELLYAGNQAIELVEKIMQEYAKAEEELRRSLNKNVRTREADQEDESAAGNAAGRDAARAGRKDISQ